MQSSKLIKSIKNTNLASSHWDVYLEKTKFVGSATELLLLLEFIQSGFLSRLFFPRLFNPQDAFSLQRLCLEPLAFGYISHFPFPLTQIDSLNAPPLLKLIPES